MSNVIPISPFGVRPVVCVAGGPSVTLAQVRQIGIARSEDRIRVIAVNDAMYPCWFADLGYACDRRFWERHHGVPGFPGLKLSLEGTRYSDVRPLKNTGIEGYDETPGCIRSGSNSGYQAVHLAAKLGARKIILVGYDFSEGGARDHWFGRHHGDMDKHSRVDEWRRLFQGLTDELNRRGIEVVNASLSSTIKWLPMVSLESVMIR